MVWTITRAGPGAPSGRSRVCPFSLGYPSTNGQPRRSDRLLTNLFVLDQVPAWTTNRLSRLVRGAKRYLIDPSLVTAALNVDAAAVMRDGDLLGRIIETFAAAQIRPELEVVASRPRLHHLREKDGRREIDLLVEVGGGAIVAIETKATAAPDSGDARHLAWLRDVLGDRFLAGAVLHTGPHRFSLGDRLFALPLAVLWG